MTMTSSPPMRTSPIVMTVSSGLNVRLASLYGSVMRSTSCTPSSSSISRGSTLPLPTTPSTVRDAPDRSVHVHAELHEMGDHLLHLRVARPLLHHDYHVLLLSGLRPVRLSLLLAPGRLVLLALDQSSGSGGGAGSRPASSAGCAAPRP